MAALVSAACELGILDVVGSEVINLKLLRTMLLIQMRGDWGRLIAY